MLVAIAVLSLLVVIFAKVVALTADAVGINAKNLDATGQARVVFDRLASDLAARPTRSDLQALFTKLTGNDTLQFYTGFRGYSGTRQIAEVAYQIPQAALTPGGAVNQLLRGASGTSWTGGTPISFSQPAPSPANTDYDVLASGVFRLEFCFLNTGSSTATPTTAGFLSNTPQASGVTAVVVALAVLDGSSLKLLSSTQVQQLSGDLNDCTEGSDPLSGWASQLAQASFGAGMPKPVLQNIRIYQRTFYVP